MTEAEKIALKVMPYTCPILDDIGEDLKTEIFKSIAYNYKVIDAVDRAIEQIKKDITCPFRVALEAVCGDFLEEKQKNNE